MKTVTMIVVLHATLWAQTQSVTVPLKQPSLGLPVTFSGTLKCSEEINGKGRKETEQGNVNVVNSSPQDIIAIVVSVNTACFRGPIQPMVDRRDFLFKNPALVKGESMDIDLAFDGSSSLYGIAMPSVLSAELIFVQFVDGSTWGDKSALDEFTHQRKEVEELLNRLAHAPNETTFLSILNEKQNARSPAGSTARSIGMMQKQVGIPAAVNNVVDRLRIADERRKAWIPH